jgi:small basic protein (TIGR04137 family)
MSLHPSLKVDTAGAQQRTVLTRIERIKDLMKKDLWHEEHSVTGLPKTKIIKVKAARKEEKTEEETTEGEAAAAAPAAEKK